MKLICYLSNGYPTIEKSVEMARIYTEAGCDVIEVDFPSRNPYLEGDFIVSGNCIAHGGHASSLRKWNML